MLLRGLAGAGLEQQVVVGGGDVDVPGPEGLAVAGVGGGQGAAPGEDLGQDAVRIGRDVADEA